MNYSRFAATFWFLAFIVVLVFLVRSRADSGSGPSDEGIIFDMKNFYDSSTTVGDGFVSISGTILGEGVSHKNNTTNISCYKARMECLVSEVEQIGANQIGRLGWPQKYKIVKWDSFEIVSVSDHDSLGCNKVTISLARKRETALWVEEPVNQASAICKDSDTKTYKWTIEDSLYWRHRLSKR